MSKRALRRHQQRVAKLRHVLIIWTTSHTWPWERTPFNSLPEHVRWRGADYRRQPWQQISRCTMNGEPKLWQRDFNIRPSRIRQNQMLRGVERGLDPDLKRWPDYRRPHLYYW